MSICSKIGHCRRNRACSCGRAEPHHPFHAGPVVPGAVEQHDLALGRQMLDIALEIPLAAFALAGSRQCGDAHRTGAEVLGDPLDGPALARGVTTFEDHHDPRAGGLDPLLQLDEFGLQPEQLGLVDVVRNLRGRLRRPNRIRLCSRPNPTSGGVTGLPPRSTPRGTPPTVRAAPRRRSSRHGRR